MGIGIIGGVLQLPDFQNEFGLTTLRKIQKPNLSASKVSVMQAGAVAGALGAFPVADKFGRESSQKERTRVSPHIRGKLKSQCTLSRPSYEESDRRWY